MSKSKDDILAELQGNLTEIYAHVGAALSAWSMVEDEMCRIFTIAIGSDSPLFPAEAYHAVVSAEARLAMVSAVVRRRVAKDAELLDRWTKLQAAIGKKAKKRNEVAHCQVVTLAELKSGTNTPYAIPYWAATKVSIRANSSRVGPGMLGMDLGHAPLTIANLADRIASFRRLYERVSDYRSDLAKHVKTSLKSP